MKRNVLALAVGAALVLPLVAQAAPTVYGRLNLSVDYMDVDDGTKTDGGWALNSNASRVGVKGNEKLSDEFTVVYKAEWEVQGDVKAASELDARERYIGLKHFQWGTVRLGYIDSPLKNAEDSVDVFNDHSELDMGNFIYGQKRLGNSLNYVSPKFLDVFGANVSLVPGEKQLTATVGPEENHLADGYSAAFSYEDDSLYLGAALDKEIEDMDAVRLNARFKMGDLTLSGMYQTAENSFGPSETEESVVGSFTYDLDKWTVRGQYLQSNKDKFDVGSGLNQQTNTILIGGGIDYSFTQSTKVYGNAASIVKDDKYSYVDGAKDRKGFLVGAGIETRF
ncbi:porin [Agitococcus lubricus]|uniref:Putative porin n=1 Tax=Agitococcus lubricus TaxID=1077255 RepID=A0A2T5IVE5_9GAMM|nr:porin [Agitococcus lubricus]PTQ87864.1 putative porin [Agitococcus lubricus]